MTSYKEPDFKDRRRAGVAAKKAMLEKYRAASKDPSTGERQAARAAVQELRAIRVAKRSAAKIKQDAQAAEEAGRVVEAAKALQREQLESAALAAAQEVERQAALLEGQKAARDARYAARKAAKKVRRRGY